MKAVVNQFFMRLQKEQQRDNQQKVNLNLPENACEAVKPYFGPQNMFNCTFTEHQDRHMRTLVVEIR